MLVIHFKTNCNLEKELLSCELHLRIPSPLADAHLLADHKLTHDVERNQALHADPSLIKQNVDKIAALHL